MASQDLRITAAPLELANHLFLVVTLVDISSEKHKQRLERQLKIIEQQEQSQTT